MEICYNGEVLSSIVNEDIQVVFNCFYKKIPYAQKSTKRHKKHKNVLKQISDFFPLRCF